MKNTKETSCMFIGHQKLYHDKDAINMALEKIIDELIERKYTAFYVGVGDCRGFDGVAELAVMHAKQSAEKKARLRR